jgi:hypothetical protein
MLKTTTIPLEAVSFLTSVVLAFGCASSSPSSFSGTGSGDVASPGTASARQGGYGRLYDTSTVETIHGKTVRVEHVASRTGRSEGVHVILSTEGGGTIPVHLGPAWFVDNQELIVQPGDALAVTGSRVTLDGAPALIARTIVKGEDELVLRDEAGFPAWSASRRRGARPAAAGSEPPATSDASSLSDSERQALHDALDDEYRAWATYDQVIRDFGSVRPFINIREAEARHIEALRTLFGRYELEVPANTWPGRVPRFASLREACEAGSEREIANVALYDRLIRSTGRQDILEVFGNLQRASEERHLPAFRRCAAGGAGGGPR